MLKTVTRIFLGGLLLNGAVFTTALFVLHTRGYELFSVQSDSMRPTFSKGDALVVNKQPVTLLPGDIMSYRSAQDVRVIVSHRLKSIEQNGYYVLQGDANANSDPPVTRSQIIGESVAMLPHFGYVLGVFQSRTGLVALVYVPATLLVVLEINHIVRLKPRFAYRAHAWQPMGKKV